MKTSDNKICEKTISLIGNKWSLMILNQLNSEKKTMRFNEFLVSLKPISSKTLSARLKELSKQGIIKKNILENEDGGAVKIEYELTKKGEDLIGMFELMREWGKKWHSI